MSNVSSDLLHRLVSSLEKSEKRYFKLYINKQGEDDKGHYERLFDAVSKQIDYDEEALIHKFRGESFVKRFSVTKNRLYNHILSALEGYHSASSVRAKLHKKLHHIEILFSKGLYKQCKKALASIEKQAAESEEFTCLLEVAEWKRKIHEKLNFSDMSQSSNAELADEVQTITDKLQRENRILETKYSIFATLYQKGKTRCEPDLNEVLNLKKTLDKEEKAYSSMHLQGRYHFNHAASAYYFLINDHQSSLHYIERNIEVLELSQNHMRTEPIEYFNLLSNAVYECSRLKLKNKANDYLQRLKALSKEKEDNSKVTAEYFVGLSMTKLAYFHMNGMIDEALLEFKSIEKGMAAQEHKIGDIHKAGLLFSMATMYIKADRHNDALKSLNMILNTLSINESEDLFCFAQMLHLVTHVELDNREFLTYALKSTKRFLLTRRRVYKFENTFLALVKALSRVKDDHQEREAFCKFVDDVRVIRKDEFERGAFEYFDFLGWAERKVEGLDSTLRISA